MELCAVFLELSQIATELGIGEKSELVCILMQAFLIHSFLKWCMNQSAATLQYSHFSELYKTDLQPKNVYTKLLVLGENVNKYA